MIGVAYEEATYHSTYGTSLPCHDAQRETVRVGRLQGYDALVLREIDRVNSTNNPIGGCCEYVMLVPYLGHLGGQLRTIHSMAYRTNRGRSGKGKFGAADFCDRCKKLATNATEHYPGLTIIDNKSSQIYESATTVRHKYLRV
jgi:hypothetical protein